MNTSEEIQKK